MAKPIELGLELKGRDAARLKKYLNNPVDTPSGKTMMSRAERLAKQMKW